MAEGPICRENRLDLLEADPYYAASFFGALAQLGERNTGSVEVSGSIPLGSTKTLNPPCVSTEDFFVRKMLDFLAHMNTFSGYHDALGFV